MKLDQYKQKNGLTNGDIARAIGVSKTYISRICSEKRTPSLTTANKIVSFTKGAVTHKDLINSHSKPHAGHFARLDANAGGVSSS